jgi:hypothetical protein
MDLAGIGIHDKGLMLGERGRTEYRSDGEDCEWFHCVSPGAV